MIRENADELSPSFNALHLAHLPDMSAQLKLHVEQLLSLTPSEVLFSLPQELDEDNGRESVRLRAHPIDVSQQDLHQGLVEEHLVRLGM